MSDELQNDGSLSVGKRLSRIEDSLDRIEKRIERKVDESDVKTISTRLQLLEAGETPLGKVMLDQFKDIMRTVTDIREHGSSQAQDANTRVSKLEARVELLATQDQRRRASDQTVMQIKDSRFKWGMIVVTFLGVLLAGLNILEIALHTGAH